MLRNEDLLTNQLVQCTSAMRRAIEEMRSWAQLNGTVETKHGLCVYVDSGALARTTLDLSAARSDAVDCESPAYDAIVSADEIEELEQKVQDLDYRYQQMERAYQELSASIPRRISEGTEAQRNGYENRIKELQAALDQQKALNMSDINKALETECRESNRENEALRAQIGAMEADRNRYRDLYTIRDERATALYEELKLANGKLTALRSAVTELLKP